MVSKRLICEMVKFKRRILILWGYYKLKNGLGYVLNLMKRWLLTFTSQLGGHICLVEVKKLV